MEHPTEIAIERYVLDAPEGRELSGSISEHLKACGTCNALAQEIRTFYETATLRMTEDQHSLAATRTLVSQRQLRDRPPLSAALLPRRNVPASFVTKILTIGRQHPLASGASMVGVVTIAVLAGLLFARPSIDSNPSYVTLNFESLLVSVYNTKNQVTLVAPWCAVTSSATGAREEQVKAQILVVHPPEGRQNVIITSLKLGKRTWEKSAAQVRFLSGTGDELLAIPSPNGNVTFRGRAYDRTPDASFLAITRTSANDALEFVVTYNTCRSPQLIQRCDTRGNVLGQLWHFGMVSPDTATLVPGGEQRVIFYGQNDLDDYKRVGRAIIDVVDPQRISGSTESSATRGFGLPATDAELFYVAFPIPDAALATNSRIGVLSVRRESPVLFDAFVAAGSTDGSIGYDAIFDTALHVLEIKPNNALIDLHRQLYEKGKLPDPLSDAYLKALVGRTEYWNGSRWSDHWSPVEHSDHPQPRSLR